MRQVDVYAVNFDWSTEVIASYREDGGPAYVLKDTATGMAAEDIKNGLRSPKTGMIIRADNGKAFLDFLPYFYSGSRVYACLPYEIAQGESLTEGGPGSGRKPGSAKGLDKGRKPGAKNLKNRDGGEEQPPVAPAMGDSQKNLPGVPEPIHTSDNFKAIIKGAFTDKIKPCGRTSYKAEMNLPDGRKINVMLKPVSEDIRDLRGSVIPLKSQPFREAMSYQISQALEFGIVPETPMVNHPEKGLCSAQLWINGGKDMQALEVEDNISPIRQMQIFKSDRFFSQFEQLHALDLVIGNMDRHGKNFTVNLENSKLNAIDNGLTLPNEIKGNWADFRCAVTNKFIPGSRISDGVKAGLLKMVAKGTHLIDAAKSMGMKSEGIKGVQAAIDRASEILKWDVWLEPQDAFKKLYVASNKKELPSHLHNWHGDW